jgi:DNA-binding response OmpR family regulator
VTQNTPLTVLVVEDDPAIAGPLVRGLVKAGFAPHHVATARDALADRGADLVLLDLGLPDGDGIDVCRQLRARSDVPIIVVTARGDEFDRVIGLEVGADDYVVKPFGMRELVARIRAVLRRSGSGAIPTESQSARTQVADLVVDRRTHRVSLDGDEVDLTPTEFSLLALLAEDPGAAYRREDILEQVWDRDWYGPSKTIDVHIASLRRKLGNPAWIETVRGVGFRLGSPR